MIKKFLFGENSIGYFDSIKGNSNSPNIITLRSHLTVVLLEQDSEINNVLQTF